MSKEHELNKDWLAGRLNNRGFTCGTFDLTHSGHFLMFKECRESCDYLIVGVQIDPSIDRPDTKRKPVQTLEERIIQVESCRWVDEVVWYSTEEDLVRLLKQIRPDVRFLGDDWRGKHFTGDDLTIQVLFNSRDHNYSTTNLIKRIINENKKITTTTETTP